MRKTEHSPLQVHGTVTEDQDPEDYESMSNVPTKQAQESIYGNLSSIEDKNEDVYNHLFKGLKSDVRSSDPVSDPVYTNVGETAERHSTGPTVPFSDYSDSTGSNTDTSGRTSSGFVHARTSTDDNTYTNVSSVEESSKDLSTTDCDSLDCDKRSSIPVSSINSNIPGSCDSVCNIPSSLQNDIPEKSQIKDGCSVDKKQNIPLDSSQKVSVTSDCNDVRRSNSTQSTKSNELNSRKSSESSDKTVDGTPKVPARRKSSSSRYSDPKVPDLPPKSDRGDMSGDLVIDQKRLSRDTAERKSSEGEIKSMINIIIIVPVHPFLK